MFENKKYEKFFFKIFRIHFTNQTRFKISSTFCLDQHDIEVMLSNHRNTALILKFNEWKTLSLDPSIRDQLKKTRRILILASV